MYYSDNLLNMLDYRLTPGLFQNMILNVLGSIGFDLLMDKLGIFPLITKVTEKTLTLLFDIDLNKIFCCFKVRISVSSDIFSENLVI